MKMFVTTMEALRKNKRQGETHFIKEIYGFLSFPFPAPLNVFFFCINKKSHLVSDQTQCFDVIYILFYKV